MATKTKAAPSTVFSVLGDTLESAAESFEEATANSRDSAKRAAATTKRALGIGAHKAAYGVAFGLVYSAVFITEMLPKGNLVRRGFIEGTEAALDSRRKAQTLREKKHTAEPKNDAAAPKKKSKPSSRARKVVEKRAASFDGATAQG
ncbi:MAG TPA: hypothetical protein VGM54_07735 [Chthoniobacter sp.]|jgi:hypothetical protein